ncbi:MAG TPA: GntR family transcriptional regulator [Solirubrobacteraceae bacterium]|nr:GntR family transcriptional regulator [Solirubrobacteraceae bacterium]
MSTEPAPPAGTATPAPPAAKRVAAAPKGRPSGPRELLADRAYSELRDRIVTLKIAPGAPINEDQLGEELEMGRTPVREAIKRLALENLVAVFPRRGTFASEINITDLAHISDVRMQLEGHAAYRAAERLTEAQRAELDRLLAELADSQGSDDVEALMALDARVHRFIYRCAGNPYLEDTLARYFNLSLRIWHLVLDRLPHLFARVHEHDDVLHAIAAGDAARARAVLELHIATFEREIRAVL